MPVLSRSRFLVVTSSNALPFFAKFGSISYYPFLLSTCSKSPKMVRICSSLRTPDKGLATACIAMIIMDLFRLKKGLTEEGSQESRVKLTLYH